MLSKWLANMEEGWAVVRSQSKRSRSLVSGWQMPRHARVEIVHRIRRFREAGALGNHAISPLSSNPCLPANTNLPSRFLPWKIALAVRRYHCMNGDQSAGSV